MNRVLERLIINHELLDHFISDPKNSREKYGVTFARTLKEQIEKRFPEKGLNCSLRRSANYLDPTFKGLHLMEAKRFEETKDDIVKEWKEIDTDEEHEAEVDEPEVEVAEKPKEPLSPTAKLRERLRQAQGQAGQAGRGRTDSTRELVKSKIRKEMERYEMFSIPPKGVRVLDWWKHHRNVLPILGHMARAVLAVPASSASSERVFSTGSNVVTKKRTRLLPTKVENSIIINENRAKVEDFMKRTSLDIVKTKENAFLNINIEEIVRVAEDAEEPEGAEMFGSDDSEDSEDDYDDTSEESEDDE